MKKLFTLAHLGCWIAIAAFVCASAAYFLYVRDIIAEAMWGNDITDPLAFVLNYLTPVGGCGVVGLGFLWQRGVAPLRSPRLAAIVSGVALVFLLAYAVWLFQTMLPSEMLSDIVWWLKPIGRVF